LKKLWPFGLWLVAFYTVWLTIIIATDGWQSLQHHWPIALAMALGSYIAGSTPMGGGTVGFPVLVLLFIVFFGLPGMGIGVPPLVSMMLSLGLIAGAYLGEVFRGALDSVDGNEVLAAQAMGMSRMQVLLYIELPQMLRFSVPGMVNEFTTVLKYSPFAYTVGIPEVMKQAMALSAATLRGVEIYLAVGLVYFAIYKVLVTFVWALEKRYRVPGLTEH